MKKLFLALLLVLLVPFIFAQSGEPIKHAGQPIPPPGTLQLLPFVKNWMTPTAIYAFNSSGGTLKKNWVVVWDTTKTVVVDSTPKVTASDTMTLLDTTTTYRWKQFRLHWLNSCSACTLWIIGKDTALAAQRDTIIFTSTASVSYSTKLWRKITMVIWRHGASNDSIACWVSNYMSVTTTAVQDHPKVAGVVSIAAAADSLIKIFVSGVVLCSLLNTVEITPGMNICTSGTAGYGEGDATPTDGSEFGRALQAGYAAKGLYRVLIGP